MEKRTIYILITVCVALLLLWFGARMGGDKASVEEIVSTDNTEVTTTGLEEDNKNENIIMDTQQENSQKNPIATLHTNKGDIALELFLDRMPITAGNFLKLAESGYYDGIKFHRVIDGFMIQGGDPNSKGDNTATYGTGGPGYAIEDEFVDGISNVRGTISMANSGPNSGGSQFFINLVNNTNLDFDKQPLSSKHPVFGKVVGSLDVVDSIGGVAVGARDIPVDAVVIENISVAK